MEMTPEEFLWLLKYHLAMNTWPFTDSETEALKRTYKAFTDVEASQMRAEYIYQTSPKLYNVNLRN